MEENSRTQLNCEMEKQHEINVSLTERLENLSVKFDGFDARIRYLEGLTSVDRVRDTNVVINSILILAPINLYYSKQYYNLKENSK